MTRFPSQERPDQVHWLRAPIALRHLRTACQVPLTRSTFYRWLHNGTIPARKIVGSWYVAGQDIEEFAKESFNP